MSLFLWVFVAIVLAWLLAVTIRQGKLVDELDRMRAEFNALPAVDLPRPILSFPSARVEAPCTEGEDDHQWN